MKPLSPREIADRQVQEIPEFVIEAVNNKLTAIVVNGRATLRQKEVLAEIVKCALNTTEFKDYSVRNLERMAFDTRWLDFEPHYRANGWKVIYDKPAYNESYEACWEFTAIQ